MLALFTYVVLLLVIMPALLLGMGKWVAVFTTRPPKFIGFPTNTIKPAIERSLHADSSLSQSPVTLSSRALMIREQPQ